MLSNGEQAVGWLWWLYFRYPGCLEGVQSVASHGYAMCNSQSAVWQQQQPIVEYSTHGPRDTALLLLGNWQNWCVHPELGCIFPSQVPKVL